MYMVSSFGKKAKPPNSQGGEQDKDLVTCIKHCIEPLEFIETRASVR